jgi:hypothetical protein
MACFDYADDGIAPWTLPELKGKIRDQIRAGNQITGNTGEWAYQRRTEKEEVFRVPRTMVNYLRIALYDHKNLLQKGSHLGDGVMNRLNGYVDGYMGSYNE